MDKLVVVRFVQEVIYCYDNAILLWIDIQIPKPTVL